MSLPVFLYHWLAGLLSQCQPTFLLFVKQGAKVAWWWEHSPPTNVAQVQILVSTPYVGWVCCWFSPNAPRGFSLGTPVFPPPQKPTFPNSNSTRNQTKNHYVDVQPANRYLFIYFIHFICLAVHRGEGECQDWQTLHSMYTLVALVLCRWEGKMESTPVNTLG